MAEIPKWIAVSFVALLTFASAVYVDCRVAGGSPDSCRIIFRNTATFIQGETKDFRQ